jgi:hypothetical protein
MSLDIYLYENKDDGQPIYNANVTHNLGRMAKEAGFYQALWRPEEIGIEKAKDLVPYIRNGINKMCEDPDYYKQFDSPNGWGTYDDFLLWLIELNHKLKLNLNSFVIVGR